MSQTSIPALLCASATMRRSARAVSQLYAAEFNGLLEGPQFSLLMLLHKNPGTSQASLVEQLALDKTTLSRNLNLMNRKQWIEPVAGSDRRQRGYQLTGEGKKLLDQARPAWQRAQTRLRTALGETGCRVGAADRARSRR